MTLYWDGIESADRCYLPPSVFGSQGSARLAREGAAGHAQRHQNGDADQEHGPQRVVAHWLLLSGTILPMNTPPTDIGDCIPPESRERARELGCWMAAHPDELRRAFDKSALREYERAYERLASGKKVLRLPDGFDKYLRYLDLCPERDAENRRLARVEKWARWAAKAAVAECFLTFLALAVAVAALLHSLGVL